MMGRYSSIDWIQFEWDNKRTGLGPVRSSLPETGGWYHQLGPWLDPGPAPGVSICRLVVDGRVVVLARTRTGGSDSRRTIQVRAYLGGSASLSSPMPNVRQALALAPGWASLLPDDDVPLDLARMIEPYSEAGAALDRQARAGAAALAPIVSEALRSRGRTALSVASGGDSVVQLWGLVDILDLLLGHYPETFSTYESDDLQQGAEVVFLQGWPGPSSRASRRARVDLRAPDQADKYGDIAAMAVAAYARKQLVAVVRSAGITDGTPVEERIRLLENVTYEPTTPASRPEPAPPANRAGPTTPVSPSEPAPPVSRSRPASVSRSGPAAPVSRSEAAAPASRATPAEPVGGAAPEDTWAPRPPARESPYPATRTSAAGGAPSSTPSAAPSSPSSSPAQPASRPAAARSQPARAAHPGDAQPGAAQPQQAAQKSQPTSSREKRPRTGRAAASAARDVFELFQEDLAEAGTAKEAMDILRDVRVWTATRQPSEVRNRIPDLIPDLERLLPDGHINPILRELLTPDTPPKKGRGGSDWREPRWLVVAVALALVLVLQIVILFFR
ncbi:hypothetical protein [Nonomuraea fuscirosea]|uniref:hypothetical protein n=1 Tax=Nonomuraea fuscirosea TaxID=1291556 RepID=UPI0033EE769B